MAKLNKWTDTGLLFNNNTTLKVGILMLCSNAGRERDGVNLRGEGLAYLRNESKYQWERCNIENMDNYDVVMVPLTSVDDAWTAACQLPPQRRARVIIGGQGCIAIRSLIGLVDMAVFGRAEGQIDTIIEDTITAPNIWRAVEDPFVEGHYEIRQADHLLMGEDSIGCDYKCDFCQYTHTRRSMGGDGYSPGQHSNVKNHFEHFSNFNITKSGRYITAWDGLSHQTRARVHKGVTDKMIFNKFERIIQSNYRKPVTLKIFCIVGYPWEDETTIFKDIKTLENLLAPLNDIIGGRIFGVIQCTPLNPMPLTPLGSAAVSGANWNKILSAIPELINGEKITIIFDRRVPGPFATFRYAMVNRGAPWELIRSIKKPKTADDAIPLIHEYAEYTGRQQADPVQYLYMPARIKL